MTLGINGHVITILTGTGTVIVQDVLMSICRDLSSLISSYLQTITTYIKSLLSIFLNLFGYELFGYDTRLIIRQTRVRIFSYFQFKNSLFQNLHRKELHVSLLGLSYSVAQNLDFQFLDTDLK